MRQRAFLVTCLMAICWIIPSNPGRAQITVTAQKLLPSTVAVELKTTRKPAAPAAKSSSPAGNPGPSAANSGADSRSGVASHVETYAQIHLGTLNLQNAPVDALSYASGTIVSDDGWIVTAIGEVDGGQLTVTLDNGQEVSAKLMVHDRRSGLQLLKIEADDLKPVEIFDGDALLGEQVVTAMCTDVDDRAVATGIVTALNRSVDGISTQLLQTDVAIGPMSAGAPVANLNGELIGIWIGRSNAQTPGSSLAIPAFHVQRIVDARDETRPVVLERGYLGIQLSHDDGIGHPRVTMVVDDSAAMEGGVKKGDVILEIDDKVTKKSRDVVESIGRKNPGDQVKLTIDREGEKKNLVLELRSLPKAKPDTGHRVAVGPYKAAHVLGLDQNGLLQYWHLGGEPKPQVDASGSLKLTPEQTRQLIENYNRAYEAQRQVGTLLGQTTVRVQRSDVEKQLSELTEQVVSLQSEVEKLARELKSLGEKLKDQ